MNDRLGLGHMLQAGGVEELVHGPSHAQIGVYERPRPTAWQEKLLFFQERTPENGSPELFPGGPTVTKFQEFPDVFFGFAEVVLVGGFWGVLHKGFDVVHEPSAADVADPEGFSQVEELLVGKSGIQADEDRNVLAVPGADHMHDVLDHFDGVVGMVGMGVSAAKNRVNDEPVPGHLERRKPEDFLVGGLDPFAFKGVVIVHDHGVQPQDDDFWGFQFQTPEE